MVSETSLVLTRSVTALFYLLSKYLSVPLKTLPTSTYTLLTPYLVFYNVHNQVRPFTVNRIGPVVSLLEAHAMKIPLGSPLTLLSPFRFHHLNFPVLPGEELPRPKNMRRYSFLTFFSNLRRLALCCYFVDSGTGRW
jgi:hypothetical protein